MTKENIYTFTLDFVVSRGGGGSGKSFEDGYDMD